MPTSAHGTSSKGYTLIEVLVVIAIVGVMAGTVGLWLGGDSDGALRAEAGRIGTLLEAGRQRAILTGRPIEFVADPAGYHFESPDDAGARRTLEEEPWGPRRLPEGLSLDDAKLRVLLSAEGEVAPFRFRVLGRGGAWRLEGSGEAVEWEKDHA